MSLALESLYERMWYQVFVGRCVAGDQPEDAELVADDAVDHFKSRLQRREDQIRAGAGTA